MLGNKLHTLDSEGEQHVTGRWRRVSITLRVSIRTEHLGTEKRVAWGDWQLFPGALQRRLDGPNSPICDSYCMLVCAELPSSLHITTCACGLAVLGSVHGP